MENMGIKLREMWGDFGTAVAEWHHYKNGCTMLVLYNQLE